LTENIGYHVWIHSLPKPKSKERPNQGNNKRLFIILENILESFGYSNWFELKEELKKWEKIFSIILSCFEKSELHFFD